MTWALIAACGVATIPAGLRWLRIAQREHYHSGSVARFAWRWWTTGGVNLLLIGATLVGVIGSLWSVWLGFLVAVAQVGPLGLSVRGTTSTLAWTPRLRRLAVVVGVGVSGAYLAGGLADSPFVVAMALAGLPFITDLSLAVLAPLEARLGSKWVEKAARRLQTVGADVVAITGSYGKTTTKSYVAHLVGGSRRILASPASFNNRMGLARAINENLAPGTEVFIAEMGTYGPGEIAELCEWIPPKVAALVAIGPVHLERFKTVQRIVDAKAEILDRAEVGVICVDSPLLAELARVRSATMRIIQVSAEGDRVRLDGQVVATVPQDVFGPNLAVALGIGVALGLDSEALASRVGDLPVAEHRQSVSKSDAGFTIIDDTFNSNPAGAERALGLIERWSGKTRVVVTPGMVELGPVQDEENRRFAAMAASISDHLIIVGKTNRHALRQGAANGKASVTVVDSREQAVAWVLDNLGPGDAVLYENDLPDHYP